MTDQTRLPEDGAAVVAGGRSATISPALKRAAATTAPTEAHPQTEEWLFLERHRRALETELKSIISKQDQLRQQILERWSMTGTSNERVDGLTVHMRRDLYPKIADPYCLAQALREEGLTDLLTVDTKALGAWLSVYEDEGRPLPESIAEHVTDRFERFALAVKLK